SGAADVLEALGVRIGLEPERARQVLAQTGIVFLFAQTHHPAMKHVGNARKQIGRRTIFNLLGPLASPARVTRQLVGVFSSDWLVPYAQALKDLGSESAWIVHGRDGLDEISISGATDVAILDHGDIARREITPEEAGLKRWPLADIRGGDAAHNAAMLRHLLEGDAPGAYHDIVLLNAAAALVVAGQAQTLKDGAALAEAAIRGGGALAAFNTLRMASNA
ncbi:MAG TPA: anthranilate phosphoribosyltransferase, partial [Rhizomicrobium sp.]